MKYFISSNDKYDSFEDYICLSSKKALPIILDFIEKHHTIGFDTETNGLDAWVNDSLLYILGNKEVQFVIESNFVTGSFITRIFKDIKEKDVRLIGTNIKFDLKRLYADYGLVHTKVFDVMIAEQRLWQKLGISSSFGKLCERYLNLDENDIDKRIRTEFINCDVLRFKLEKRHLDYACGDVEHLFAIKQFQDKGIYEKKLYNLIYKVEMPLVSIVANAELLGFRFDSEKWIQIYDKSIKRKLETEQELDIEFRNIRDNFSDLNSIERIRCTGGRFDHIRKESSLLSVFDTTGKPKGLDLFGEPLNSKQVTGVKKKVQLYPNNINYGSDTQVMAIFGYLKAPLITKSDVYDVPKFNTKNKVDKTYYSYLTNSDAMEKRKVDYPESKMNKFIDLLLEHRKLCTRVDTFGLSFINKINKHTGCLHTEFRQAHAVTGRFQSGGGKNSDKPNFQNIPAVEEMRNCFLAREGYTMVTADYTGAELIVMCSLSQDMKLLEISKKDMHSYVATNCWRAIYDHRHKTYEQQITNLHSTISQQDLRKLSDENYILSKEFFVDKSKEKKHLRTSFKPITFGVIYGLYAKGLAKYLNITVDEAKVVIKTLKTLFPKVFKMVEGRSRFAENNGYIILNERTNSRAYFPNIIKELRGEYSRDIHFSEISGDINEARNISIQGTQADFIKEASVNLHNYIKENNIDANILSWVHDEIVTEVEFKYDGRSKEWKDYLIDNPTGLSYTKFNGEVIHNLDFPKVKQLIMNDTANQYLHNVEIGTDVDIAPFWVKEPYKYETTNN